MVKPDSNRNSGNLGFEAELFKAADKLRGIEKEKEALKGVLPKDYARPAMSKVMLGELIDLISGIALGEEGSRSKDVLGHVYEYFLGQFAGAEGKIRSAF
jgi:type I restriction enzyme M protein